MIKIRKSGSFSKKMADYTYCSIPLRKTKKKYYLADDKQDYHPQKKKIKPITTHKSKSMIVLYKSLRSITSLESCQSDLPSDLVDVRLDPLIFCNAGCGCGDCTSNDLTEDDKKIIDDSITVMEELGCLNRSPSCDIDIDHLIEIYHIDDVNENNIEILSKYNTIE